MKRGMTALAVAALVMGAVAMAGCGLNKKEAGGSINTAVDPVQVVEEFFAAMIQGDGDTTISFLTDSSRLLVNPEELALDPSQATVKCSTGRAQVSGDRATVPASLIIQDKNFDIDLELEFNMVLVRENNRWKIAWDEVETGTHRAHEKLEPE